MFKFISTVKSEFFRLFELRNWTKFLDTITKATKKSKKEVEKNFRRHNSEIGKFRVVKII